MPSGLTCVSLFACSKQERCTAYTYSSDSPEDAPGAAGVEVELDRGGSRKGRSDSKGCRMLVIDHQYRDRFAAGPRIAELAQALRPGGCTGRTSVTGAVRDGCLDVDLVLDRRAHVLERTG